MDNARNAYEMHLAGLDQFDIAQNLNVTVDDANGLVDSYAATLPSPTNVEARRTEIQRVDQWLSRLDAEYILQNIPIDKAVTAFCRLSERRSKLLGIDAPSRAEVTALLQTESPSSIDEEVAALIAQLNQT